MVVPDTSSVTFQTPLFAFLPKPCSIFSVDLTPSLPSIRVPTLSVMNRHGMTGVSVNQDSRHKTALSFILSSSDSDFSTDKPQARKQNSLNEPTVAKRRRIITTTSMSSTATPRPSTSKPIVKKGSKFCSIEGCTSRAKHARRCWKHGGWVLCKMPDCFNRAKSKGVCWSHGGGTVCSFEKCDTIAVSNGFCWAHGGGKRCQMLNCSKPAYERTQNYCQMHYEELGASIDYKINCM